MRRTHDRSLNSLLLSAQKLTYISIEQSIALVVKFLNKERESVMNNIFASIGRRVVREQRYNRAERELRALSDRELDDLGIRRVDIRNAVRQR